MKKILLSLTLLIFGYSVSAQDWMKKYDEVGVFENDLAYVRKNKKYGYVDKNGKEIIPCIYTYVGAFNEQGLVWVNKGGKIRKRSRSIEDGLYGLYDREGNLVLPVEYKHLGTMMLSDYGKPYYWFKSVTGLSPQDAHPQRHFPSVEKSFFVNNKGLIWVAKRDNMFKTTEPIEIDFRPFDKISKDYIPFASDNGEKSNSKPKIKWGIFDAKTKKIVLPCNTYDMCFNPSGNYIPVTSKTYQFSINYYCIETGTLVFKNQIPTLAVSPVYNGKFMVLDESGCYFMNMQGERDEQSYDAVFASPSEDMYIVYKDSQYGAVTPDGQVIIDLKYKLLAPPDEKLICYVDKDANGKSRYGFLDMEGNQVTPPLYSSIQSFANKRALVRQGDKYGCIDTNGREILPCRFSKIFVPETITTDIYFVQEEENGPKYAYKAYTQRRLFKTPFNNIRNFDRDYNGVAFVTQLQAGKEDETVGCINKDGEMLIPCICHSYEEALKMHYTRQREGYYHWSDADTRLYHLKHYSDRNDFKLTEKISNNYWDF